MAKDAIYKFEREVRTYADLSHGAAVLIAKTKSDPVGSYFTTMSALLLTAFTFEAYLNHIGQLLFNFWEEIDSIGVKDKYNAICKHLDIKPNYSKLPYQTIHELFRFRNNVAHGRTEILKGSKEVSKESDPFVEHPKNQTEEYCTNANANTVLSEISKIIFELHKAAGLGDDPFRSGITSGSLSLKPNA